MKANYTTNTITAYTVPTEWTSITESEFSICAFRVFDGYVHLLRYARFTNPYRFGTTEIIYKIDKTTTELV